VGLDPKTCHGVLRDLLEHGLIDRRRVGPAYLYALRDEHVLVQRVLRPAFQVEEPLLDAYAKDLHAGLGPPLLALVLFGSTARGEEGAASDVDLLAVVPAPADVEVAEDAAAERAFDLATNYGNSPELLVYDVQRFQQRAEDRDPFLREVLRTGRVVHGLSLTELLDFRWPKDARELLGAMQVDARDREQGVDPGARIAAFAGSLGFLQPCGMCDERVLDRDAFQEYILARYEFRKDQASKLRALLQEVDALLPPGVCGRCDRELSK
ncbi:MAG: nucleotidyltransferase domain-containing protein, partial [Myxococcales bacterium]|nr:nucleotidyltransferase domain-containing protein [Myxococcales bacterium]